MRHNEWIRNRTNKSKERKELDRRKQKDGTKKMELRRWNWEDDDAMIDSRETSEPEGGQSIPGVKHKPLFFCTE